MATGVPQCRTQYTHKSQLQIVSIFGHAMAGRCIPRIAIRRVKILGEVFYGVKSRIMALRSRNRRHAWDALYLKFMTFLVHNVY